MYLCCYQNTKHTVCFLYSRRVHDLSLRDTYLDVYLMKNIEDKKWHVAAIITNVYLLVNWLIQQEYIWENIKTSSASNQFSSKQTDK